MTKIEILGCNKGGNNCYTILGQKMKVKNKPNSMISKRIYSPPNSLNGSSSVPEHSPPQRVRWWKVLRNTEPTSWVGNK
jgi:hypothetical protein